MKYGDFLVKVVEHNIEISSTFFGIPIHFLKLIKAATERIDYHCSINSNGCSVHHCNNGLCCCSSCFTALGHFRYLPLSNNILKEMARHFAVRTKTKLGFWRKGKGCILPRKDRSITCLSHLCSYTQMSELDLFFLNHILRGQGYEYKKLYERFCVFHLEKYKEHFITPIFEHLADARKKSYIDKLWQFTEHEYKKVKTKKIR